MYIIQGWLCKPAKEAKVVKSQNSENTELILLEDQIPHEEEMVTRITGHWFFSLNYSAQSPQNNMKRTICMLKHKRRKYIHELTHIATFEAPRDNSKIRYHCHLWDTKEERSSIPQGTNESHFFSINSWSWGCKGLKWRMPYQSPDTHSTRWSLPGF